jgi:hypothetical protein
MKHCYFLPSQEHCVCPGLYPDLYVCRRNENELIITFKKENYRYLIPYIPLIEFFDISIKEGMNI